MPKPPRTDPLEQLRRAYNLKADKRAAIKQRGGELHFDKDIRLSLQTETAWQSTQTQKVYNLGSLWLFLEFHSGNIPSKAQYIQKSTELKLNIVNVADEKEIIQYFTGEVDDTVCINNELKMALSQRQNKRETTLEAVEGEPSKKVKTEQPLSHELQVMEYLLGYERPVNSKSKCLRYPNKSFYGIIKSLIECQQKSQEENKEVAKVKTVPRIAKFREKKKLPIIIVPASPQPGNVSIRNIEKFLLKAEYDEKSSLDNPDASKVEIQKELKGKTILFEATSRPDLLSASDWEYVVAIFVQGREGEFEGWPITDHRKVFERANGFYMRLPGPLNGSAREWRVKSFIVDRNKRQTDKEIVETIWRDI